MGRVSHLTLDDLLLDRDQIQQVREWLLHGTGIMVLTQEQTGCGASSMVALLLDELQDRVHAIESVDAGAGRMSVLGQRKVILLDPLETVLGDQTLSKKLPDLIATPRVPILIAGFKRRITVSKLDDLLKKCKSAPVTRLRLRGIPDTIAHAHLAALGCADPKHVWTKSGHDLRHAVLSLRSSHLKEHLPDGTEGLRAVLEGCEGRSYADMVRIVENDPTIMLDGLFENYINAVPDIQAAADVLETLGTAEIFAAQRYAGTDDIQPEVYGTLAGIGFLNGGMTLNKPIEKFGTYWARENHRHTKKNLARGVSMSGAHPDDLPYIREMLYANPDAQAPRLAALYGEKQVWDMTRLWTQSARAVKYTSSRHASASGSVRSPKRQKTS